MKKHFINPKLLFIGLIFFGLFNYPFIQLATNGEEHHKILSLIGYIIVLWLVLVMLLYRTVSSKISDQNKTEK